MISRSLYSSNSSPRTKTSRIRHGVVFLLAGIGPNGVTQGELRHLGVVVTNVSASAKGVVYSYDGRGATEQ